MNNVRATLLTLLLMAAAPAFAQQAPGAAGPSQAEGQAQGTDWSSLSADQQRLLERFRTQWSGLPAERQQTLARGSERWLAMSPDQRSVAKQRFERWRDLPPDQRRQLRDRWQKFRALPPDQQENVRDDFRKFKSLSPERRHRLRDRWDNATPTERQRMLDNMRERRENENRARPQRHLRPPG